MKNLVRLGLLLIAMLAMNKLSHGQAAQDGNKPVKTLSKEDAAMNKKLSQDIVARFPMSKNSPIVWDNRDEQYVATYSYNKEDYMTVYDRNGSYKGTLVKRDWENQANNNAKNFFKNSRYKDMKVGSYWEVSDGPKRGSYLTATNEQGQPQFVFIDEQGVFSENPFDN